MADYRKMYLTLLDAVETSIQLLTNAQQECEDIYVESEEDEKIVPADFKLK